MVPPEIGLKGNSIGIPVRRIKWIVFIIEILLAILIFFILALVRLIRISIALYYIYSKGLFTKGMSRSA